MGIVVPPEWRFGSIVKTSGQGEKVLFDKCGKAGDSEFFGIRLAVAIALGFSVVWKVGVLRRRPYHRF
jgi:hypothetical protein